MRSLHFLLFSALIMVTAGCSPPPATATASSIAPVQPALNPVQTGRTLLEAGGRQWLEDPVPVFVQQMSYADAHKWVPMLSQEGEQLWGSQTSVWLVVFKGAWIPNDPAQVNPQPVTYPGCLLVLFRATDGRLIAAGDSLCPGQQ